MRLIHFTASTVWRGHEQKIIYLMETFRDNGYVEAQWLICPENSAIHKIACEKKLPLITFRFKSEYDFKFARQLKEITTENKVDLIFIHSSQAHTITVLSAVFFKLKTPLVLCRTLIKKIDTNFFRKWKYNYPGIRKIICLTQAVVDVLTPAINDPSRLSIVGPVTDIGKFSKASKSGLLRKEFNIPDDYKIIGNISAFVPVKDHATWVEMAEILIGRGVKAAFLLIGTGPEEEKIRNFARDKGLEDKIIFAGFRSDIPEILPELDVFVFTSVKEAAGSTILECYACKVPVVAARAGGIPEVLHDGETGLLAKPRDPDDFADKVEHMLSDADLRDRATANGYRFLTENFTLEVIGKKMFDELNEVYQSTK